MRFSLKWLLVAVTYVAVAGAAFASHNSHNSLLVAALWVVAELAVCFAALVAIFGRGERRAMALGFVLVFAVHLVIQLYFIELTPTRQILGALGYEVRSDGIVCELLPGVQSTFVIRVNLARAGEAVASLVAGLVGGALGAMAFRWAKERTTADEIDDQPQGASSRS
jgi:hypothetical protein